MTKSLLGNTLIIGENPRFCNRLCTPISFLYHLKMEESALQRSVKDGVTALWLQTQARGQFQIAGNAVYAPAGIVTFQVFRPSRPKGCVDFHTFAVRRVGHHPARLDVRPPFAGVADFEAYSVGRQHGALAVCFSSLYRARVNVVADER